MKRDACSKPQAEAKVKAQMPLKLKRDKSQIVIDNSGNKHHCEQQVIYLCRPSICRPSYTSVLNIAIAFLPVPQSQIG